MSAARDAFRMIDETCPKVDAGAHELRTALDAAASNLIDAFVEHVVKVQTNALRDALIQALEERNEEKARADGLRSDVERLQSELEAARDELQSMELPL